MVRSGILYVVLRIASCSTDFSMSAYHGNDDNMVMSSHHRDCTTLQAFMANLVGWEKYVHSVNK